MFEFRILFAIILLAVLLPAFGNNERKDDGKAKGDIYEKFARETFTYEKFTEAFFSFKNGDDIVTRKNYEVYMKLLADEFRKEFGLDELRQLSDFFTSKVGKKWLDQRAGINAGIAFFSRIQPKLHIWTCPTHSRIRIDKEGKCPICGNDLILFSGKGSVEVTIFRRYQKGKLIWEKSYKDGKDHGVQKWKYPDGEYREGFPQFYINSNKVTTHGYLKACETDSTLPKYVDEKHPEGNKE